MSVKQPSIMYLMLTLPRTECITPDHFLPHGLDVGDTELAARDTWGSTFEYRIPYTLLGLSKPGTRLEMYSHVRRYSSFNYDLALPCSVHSHPFDNIILLSFFRHVHVERQSV